MKYFLLVISLVLTNVVYSQDSKLFDSVISKLINDKKTFEMFVQLGELHCESTHNTKGHDLFTEKYLELFNALYPLPRLIKDKVLAKEFTSFEKLQKKKIVHLCTQ